MRYARTSAIAGRVGLVCCSRQNDPHPRKTESYWLLVLARQESWMSVLGASGTARPARDPLINAAPKGQAFCGEDVFLVDHMGE